MATVYDDLNLTTDVNTAMVTRLAAPGPIGNTTASTVAATTLNNTVAAGSAINAASLGATTAGTVAATTLNNTTAAGSAVTVATLNNSTAAGSALNAASLGAITPGSVAATTVNASGLITPTSAIGIAGTVTNDEAQAGSIGEYLSCAMTTVGATGTTATVVGDSVSKVITATAHGLVVGQAVVLTNSGGALPTGIGAGNLYVTAGTVTANTFGVSDTLAHALAGTNGIAPSGAGTGTQTVHGYCSFVTSTTTYDICGINLPAGDYDVDAYIFPGMAASVSYTNWEFWIAQAGASAAPTTAAQVLSQGYTTALSAVASVVLTSQWATAGTTRVKLASAGIIALAGRATFTVGTLSPQALLRARRVR